MLLRQSPRYVVSEDEVNLDKLNHLQDNIIIY